jgi:hypothetical protein
MSARGGWRVTRYQASASPVADSPATLPMTLAVTLELPIQAAGDVRLFTIYAHTGHFTTGTHFELRCVINGLHRQAIMEVLTSEPEPGGGFRVVARPLRDSAADTRRRAHRDALGVACRAHLGEASGPGMDMVIVDSSPLGVGLSSEEGLMIHVKVTLVVAGAGARVAADVEIVRHNPQAAAPYGARHLDLGVGKHFHAALIDLLWSDRPSDVRSA